MCEHQQQYCRGQEFNTEGYVLSLACFLVPRPHPVELPAPAVEVGVQCRPKDCIKVAEIYNFVLRYLTDGHCSRILGAAIAAAPGPPSPAGAVAAASLTAVERIAALAAHPEPAPFGSKVVQACRVRALSSRSAMGAARRGLASLQPCRMLPPPLKLLLAAPLLRRLAAPTTAAGGRLPQANPSPSSCLHPTRQ